MRVCKCRTASVTSARTDTWLRFDRPSLKSLYVLLASSRVRSRHPVIWMLSDSWSLCLTPPCYYLSRRWRLSFFSSSSCTYLSRPARIRSRCTTGFALRTRRARRFNAPCGSHQFTMCCRRRPPNSQATFAQTCHALGCIWHCLCFHKAVT